jgi:hypothetical protein
LGRVNYGGRDERELVAAPVGHVFQDADGTMGLAEDVLPPAEPFTGFPHGAPVVPPGQRL